MDGSPQTQSPYGCVKVLTTSEQVMFDGTVNTGDPFSGLPPVKSVVDECLKMARQFNDNKVEPVAADHRFWGGLKRHEVRVDESYPHHVLIRVEDKAVAQDVTNYINSFLSKNRGMFPRREGWKAERVVGGDTFDEAHPFMRYKETGKLDSKCARIVVVVNRAIEGMNNKYLMIEGVACTMRSVTRNIQCRGRMVRSPGRYVRGVLHVPPRDFDRFYTVTHASFGNADAINDSLRFLQNMSSSMGDAVTLDQYINDDSAILDFEIDYHPKLDWIDLVRIGQRIGWYLNRGKAVDSRAIVKEFTKPGDPPFKKEYVRAAVESGVSGRAMPYPIKREGEVIRAGDERAETILLMASISRNLRSSPPASIDIVSRESLTFREMSVDECRAWVRKGCDEDLEAVLALLEEAGEDFVVAGVNAMERRSDASMRREDLIVNETADARVRFIIDEICSRLDLDLGTFREDVEGMVYLCVAALLARAGYQGPEDLEEDGELNVAQIVHVLRDGGFMAHCLGFVTQSLLDDNKLNALQAVLGVR